MIGFKVWTSKCILADLKIYWPVVWTNHLIWSSFRKTDFWSFTGINFKFNQSLATKRYKRGLRIYTGKFANIFTNRIRITKAVKRSLFQNWKSNSVFEIIASMITAKIVFSPQFDEDTQRVFFRIFCDSDDTILKVIWGDFSHFWLFLWNRKSAHWRQCSS